MSMKRTRTKSSGSRDTGPLADDVFAKPKAPEKSWAEHTEGRGEADFTPYSQEGRYAVGHLVLHAKFGRGVIVEVEPRKATVLFEDGPRKLGQGA